MDDGRSRGNARPKVDNIRISEGLPHYHLDLHRRCHCAVPTFFVVHSPLQCPRCDDLLAVRSLSAARLLYPVPSGFLKNRKGCALYSAGPKLQWHALLTCLLS